MTEQLVSAAAVEELGRGFRGALIGPEHPEYDTARAVWNGSFDRRPALVARCASTDDVVAAVDFGRENGLEIAVRGGGHSTVGYGTCDEGLVIDLSPMHAIEVDAAAKTARAQAGATWGQFDAATQEHGLAVTGGRFSTTGIAGLTLGSGSGWLERKCGLTPDNLLAAEVVTADGRVLNASEDENPDLFWGLRGGGGNFGVVTSFTFRLHDVGPIIYGGMMVALPDRAEAILRWAREWPDGPDDLGGGIAFVSAPPEPFVPAEMHFKPVIGVIVCWTGDHAEGERVIAPLREAAQPVMDMVQPMPYTALQSMLDAGGPHGTHAYMKAEFLPELSDEAIGTLVLHGSARPGPMVQLLLEPMGGAIARADGDETAIGRRDVPFCYHALSLWMDDGLQQTADAHIGWAKEFATAIAPCTTPGVYLNYTSDTGEERVRATYGPEKYARLVALKDRYDPENLFRLNQNVRPSRG